MVLASGAECAADVAALPLRELGSIEVDGEALGLRLGCLLSHTDFRFNG